MPKEDTRAIDVLETEEDIGSAKTISLNCVRARRNLLIGHWAGGLLGLSDRALGSYAHDLQQADHAVAGDSDIVAKLKQDFAAGKIAMEDREIARILRQCHGQALRETSCTE